MARKTSTFVSAAGELFEFIKALANEVYDLGGNDEDLRRLERDAMLRRQIAELIIGKTATADTIVYPIAPTFARDMTKEGLALLKDTGNPSEIAIGGLELIPFFKRGESYILGDEMVKRAKEQGANLGQRHAEVLLEHQDEIPEEFRKYYLVFPGTIWRGRSGDRYVPCLYWCGGRWELYFRWLDYDWHSGDRLVRPRK